MTTIPVPRINANDDKVQIARWHVNPDSYVEAGKALVDLETSKAVVTIDAESNGYVRPLVPAGKIVKVGAPLYLLAASAEELAGTSETAPPPTEAAVARAPSSLPATPVLSRNGPYSVTRLSQQACRIFAERGLKPEDFTGAGLITARSLERRPQIAETPVAPAPMASAIPQGPITPDSAEISLSKQAEVQSLTIGESGNINSMLSVIFHSEKIRQRLAESGRFGGSIQPIILFELSRMLKKWRQFTAYFQSGQIHYYDRVDVGLAVDLGNGLKVVTIEGADQLMPANFYAKSVDFGVRYMRNKLLPEELTGSTITVSDLSGLNILHFHPLINGHQSAILGIGGDTSLPGCPVALNMTFDHRVSSGREVGGFLNELRKRILKYASSEEPAS